jgi:hypothetical protein
VPHSTVDVLRAVHGWQCGADLPTGGATATYPDGQFLRVPIVRTHNTVRIDQQPQPGPGLGDAVAAATTAVGVKPCGGCARRKEAMNRATPGWVRRILGRIFAGMKEMLHRSR